MESTEQTLKKVFELYRQMIILADQGSINAQDDGCRLLFGVLQDCAYKIKMLVEKEQQAHSKQRNPPNIKGEISK